MPAALDASGCPDLVPRPGEGALEQRSTLGRVKDERAIGPALYLVEHPGGWEQRHRVGLAVLRKPQRPDELAGADGADLIRAAVLPPQAEHLTLPDARPRGELDPRPEPRAVALQHITGCDKGAVLGHRRGDDAGLA